MLHFAEKQGSTRPHALMLLSTLPRRDRPLPAHRHGRLALQRSEPAPRSSDKVLCLVSAQNIRHDRLGRCEEMNERISQEVAELIRCSLE